MNSFQVKASKTFVGRERERAQFRQLEKRSEASVIIVYGRRRVGKTELIEQHFRRRKLLKFEGVQTDLKLKSQEARTYQIQHVLHQLARYADAPYIARLKFDQWTDVFDLLASFVQKGVWTLYFEEVQWLANYQAEFFAELKPIWDNQLRHNPKLLLIFCGSSPSFLIHEVLSDKAFYNRAQEEIHLQPFSVAETKAFFSARTAPLEVMLATLTCGGIPEYLKRLKTDSSVMLSLCRHSFLPRSFFSIEKDKIFVSSLSANKNFEKIIRYLSHHKYATRDEIARHVRAESGGALSALLEELEACAFIEKYTPVHLGPETIVTRYTVADPYLHYYYKFIHPILPAIENGDYSSTPTTPLNGDAFQKWLGFAFERFCRKQHRLLAKLLGFEAVQYSSGAFFTRKHMTGDTGFQIDLLFLRKDHVITVCEIKYQQARIGTSVIEEVENKIRRLLEFYPSARRMTLHKVLITATGIDPALKSRAYFDRVITLDEILSTA